METINIIISIFLGIGLAAAAGFRVFLPLLVLSLAGYYNIIPLNDSWQWAGSLTAILVLGLASILESAAYFIPFVDNTLDMVAIPLATIAGIAVMAATVANLDPIITWALAIIAGGGTAAAISSNTSAVRLGSTATTAGIANPVVATVETGTSLVMSVLSIFVPIIAFALVIGIVTLLVKFYKKLRKKRVPRH